MFGRGGVGSRGQGVAVACVRRTLRELSEEPESRTGWPGKQNSVDTSAPCADLPRASARQMGAACVNAGAQIWATVNHQGIQSVFRCVGFVHHCQHGARVCVLGSCLSGSRLCAVRSSRSVTYDSGTGSLPHGTLTLCRAGRKLREPESSPMTTPGRGGCWVPRCGLLSEGS